ncbi:hypothetical protein IE81DRAFT_364754 [Ceraceosorus guamensis]|uniref:25S rRNA (uridine-N(3))-methyltransferase BMT5-like domain-containing protein n=1 Tax=Ceraceosorus guamensis TaxID=1522189 RepID=A0A316W4W3_9BASI|nr:hypothetical protein IE81DRAFT_364754 [Ceraceosorus guamensis]PWN44772.1 hypothetical protein IE81DRAFT_364754 [Ceraceosorus guamensis]
MAKKNLKAALAGHHSRKASADKAARVEDAQKRKAESIKRSVSGASARANAEKKREKKRRRLDEGEEQREGAASEVQRGKQNVSRESAVGHKPTRLFEIDDTVLLIGEGDFSFAVSLVASPHAVALQQLLATSYDTEASCYAKYSNASANVAKLREAAGRQDVVIFEVDGGNLAKHPEVTGLSKTAAKAKARGDDVRFRRSWSKIYWGFPHVGQGHADETRNILANQLALSRFLVSAASLLSVGPVPSYAQQGVAKKGVIAKSRKRAREAHDGGPLSDEEHFSDGEEDAQSDNVDEDGEGGEETTALRSEFARVPYRAPTRAGSILISLRHVSPYTAWELPKLAKSLPTLYPQLLRTAPAPPKGQHTVTTQEAADAGSYRVWRSFDFYPEDYVDYKHVRTDAKGKEGDLFKDESKASCRCWELGRSGPA